MHLSDLAVKRPVATTTLFLAAVLLGAISFQRLEVTLFPDLRPSQLTVWVPYPDADVHEIEDAVVRPVEEALVTVRGVKGVRARIVSGGASVSVRLYPGTDPDLATLGLRERLDAVRWTLPEGVDRPVILGSNELDRPAMVLALASDDLPRAADWANDVLRPRLEQIDGVARAAVVGAPRHEVRIVTDPLRQKAAGVGAGDIVRALRAANIAAPGGYLRRREIRYALHVDSGLASAKDVENVVVARAGDRPVRIADIATVEDGYEDPRGWNRLDGRPAVGVLVAREAGANVVTMATAVRERLDEIEKEFPGFEVEIVADASPFVRQSMTGLWQAVWVGGLLAYLALVLFLRDARSPLLLVLAQPVSVIITCLFLDLLGVSLNLMSLGGIALGSGMLIDNSIICLENIHRLRALGHDAKRAAALGAREVAVPIIGSTITTCAVFGPLAWVPGTLGDLFRDQALAVAISLGVSIIVSLTLLPTLAARVRTAPPEREWMPLFRSYHALLERFLEHRWLVLGGTAALVVASAGALAFLPREVFPQVNTENLELSLELPPGTDVAATDRAVREVETWLRERPEVASVLVSVGAADTFDPSEESRVSHRGTLRAHLRDDAVDGRGAMLESLLARFADRPGWTLDVAPDRPEMAALFPMDEPTLRCEVMGPDPRRAEELAQALATDASRDVRIEGHPIQLAALETEPRVRLALRDDALVRHDLEEDDVLDGVRATTSGFEATSYRRFDEEDPVVLRARSAREPAEEEVIAGGRSYPVRELFDVSSELAPARLLRENQARVATISWDGPLRRVGEVRGALDEALVRTPLPPGYTARFGGTYQEMRDVLLAIARSFAIAAGLVLLVLAAEFESIRMPLVVFCAVPLALVGVTLVLLVSGGSINAISGMGLVILIGIVDNDAILKVDLIRRLMDEGVPVREAIMTASRQRYRPILITTVTTAVALLPLVFGRGSELRSPMALTVTGGLLAATVLTLLVMPVILEAVVGAPRSPRASGEEPGARDLVPGSAS